MTDQTQQPQAQPAAEGAGAAAELTINDLNAIRTIIDVASTRGAFRGNELEAVGKTFNKLNAFLESVAPKKEGEDAQESAQTAPQTEQPAQQPAQ